MKEMRDIFGWAKKEMLVVAWATRDAFHMAHI